MSCDLRQTSTECSFVLSPAGYFHSLPVAGLACAHSQAPLCITDISSCDWQGKARLGTIVHKKKATALALTGVKGEDQREFAKLVETARQTYNDGPRVSWGGGIMGPKSQARAKKLAKIAAKEAAQRL